MLKLKPGMENDMTVLLLGKTGIGKSTTGNKLLGVYDGDDAKQSYEIYEYNSWGAAIHKGTDHNSFKFKEGDSKSLSTTTKECQLIANHSLHIRVLDVSGFSPTFQSSVYTTVYASNQSILCDILVAQFRYELKFHRVLYFLPVRRFPEIGDGVLQQEINLMYDCFGEDIFKYMVIVITKSPFDDEQINITSELKCHTEKVFEAVIKCVASGKHISCPPIISISLQHSGDEIRKKIISIHTFHSFEGLELKIRDDICVKCNTKCQSVLTSSGKNVQADEVQGGNKTCHPDFTKKASGKVFDTIIGIVYRKYSGPPVKEVCINCQKPRGSPGCCPVHDTYKYQDTTITVDYEPQH